MWQVPNPGNPRNCKMGVQSLRPTHLAEHPPTRTPHPLQLDSYKRGLACRCYLHVAAQCSVIDGKGSNHCLTASRCKILYFF